MVEAYEDKPTVICRVATGPSPEQRSTTGLTMKGTRNSETPTRTLSAQTTKVLVGTQRRRRQAEDEFRSGTSRVRFPWVVARS